MKKTIIIVILSLFICASLVSCNTATKVSSTSNKTKVIVSFNALKEFAEAVGKDKIDVSTVIPEGTEPHDYEPTAKDMQNIGDAKIFVYNGMGMESWSEKVLKTVNNKNLIVVEASKNCTPIKNIEEDEIKEHGQYDPHTWLSIKMAKIETLSIKDALVKADPSNKDFYESNYKEFTTKLDSLFNDYNNKFASVSNKSFVTGHAAFAYFCRDFGLKQNSVENVFAEGEPSAQKMKELIEYCQKNNVKTIFLEELASPKVSETLAKEVNAKTQKIYTIESKEDNMNYIDCMEANLKMVYDSLK